MISKTDFLNLFNGKFWEKITKETSVPYELNNIPKKSETLNKLYNDIKHRNYYPMLPREYLVSNKHNYVSRIVPVFDSRENCTYFFCIKQLEQDIAVNRVEGTFGGWSLGNLIRKKEENELEELTPLSPIPLNSYNPFKWSENWKEFQKRAYRYSQKSDYNFFLKFDIANFYDTINLNLLENKIRLVTNGKDNAFVIDLLFHFLKNWNRRFEKYSQKSVGIPQDETGDCSRILANFYLQDYDDFMKTECDKHEAQYLRYADDQIIMTKTKEIAYDILFEASKELFKINLNINSGKVESFEKEEFYSYWAFEIFQLLEDTENSDDINRGIQIYFDWLDNKICFRSESVLKRIISVGLSKVKPNLKYKLMSAIYDPKFLAFQDFRSLNNVARCLSLQERIEYFNILDQQIPKIRFNSFHYGLLKFYKKYRKENFPEKEILDHIKKLALKLY